MTITSVSWIPKEASKAISDSIDQPSSSEIKELTFKSVISDTDEEEMEEDNEVAHAKAVAKSFGNSCSKTKDVASSSKDGDEVVKFLKELNMDNYDEEDDEIPMFSYGHGDLYYEDNEMDPYLNKNNTNGKDYDSEEDDVTIRPTDSLIISTSADIDLQIGNLNIYVYEESSNGNMYILDEIFINDAPMCTAWLDCPLKGGEKGNFIAIGSMESSSIDIWDLNAMLQVDKEMQQPCVQIAGKTSDCHTDSILDLAWNKEFRNIIASASVDKKVKIWDVTTGQCKFTLEHHKNKVKAVAWNHYTPQVLLSGSYDCTAVLKDGRDPSNSGLKWSTKAEVEALAWNPHSEHSFVVSPKDGTVLGFDIRASSLLPSFTLHAHDSEVSTISYNTHAPNLLATGSEDESVKLWDLSNNQPSWIATHNPNAGMVFSVSFSVDCPFLLAIGGSEENLKVWDTLSDSGVSRKYGVNNQP